MGAVRNEEGVTTLPAASDNRKSLPCLRLLICSFYLFLSFQSQPKAELLAPLKKQAFLHFKRETQKARTAGEPPSTPCSRSWQALHP